MIEWMPLLMFAAVCLVLVLGYPVAFSLAGTAMLFAGVGIMAGWFDPSYLSALPSRLFGTINNVTLMAVPLFVLMGVLLERSRIAEELLDTMSKLFGRLPGGLGVSVILVGALLAASTGIVGATVVTMGLLSLPTMLRRGYSPSIATGTICATGTLGQIIPPSIALVLLGDTLSTAYQQAQLKMNVQNPETVSVGDLFMGALVPGMILVAMYLLYTVFVAWRRPESMPPLRDVGEVAISTLLKSLLPPVLLIVTVLGSILLGAATPTEAAAVGALGAALLAKAKGQLSLARLRDVGESTLEVTSMVFMILIGAAVFSLVFRGYGGDDLIQSLFDQMGGGVAMAVLVVMLAIFLLGFILDFIEITFVVVPIVGPILLAMGVDPIWLGIMIAINLQTSFLTPPFGFALFYLRGVAPDTVRTRDIYKGVVPFIVMQLFLLLILAIWPDIATAFPQWIRSIR